MLAGGLGGEPELQKSSHGVGLNGCGLPLRWDGWEALISKVFTWGWVGKGAACLYDGVCGSLHSKSLQLEFDWMVAAFL